MRRLDYSKKLPLLTEWLLLVTGGTPDHRSLEARACSEAFPRPSLAVVEVWLSPSSAAIAEVCLLAAYPPTLISVSLF